MEFTHALQQMGIMALLSLVVGVIPAFMAAVYAFRPTEAKLTLMRPLSLASIFSGLASFCLGLINTLKFTVVSEGKLLSVASIAGLMESIVPLFVAFGSLTVAWLLVALGLRRQAR